MLQYEDDLISESSRVGYYTESEIYQLAEQVKQNAGFLNQQDVEVLKHLASKGDYCTQQATLVKS